MRDPIEKLVVDLRGQGVVFEIQKGELRWRAPQGVLTSAEENLLRDYAAIVAAIISPDTTLPDEIIIPREIANDSASVSECIDAQRIGHRGEKTNNCGN